MNTENFGASILEHVVDAFFKQPPAVREQEARVLIEKAMQSSKFKITREHFNRVDDVAFQALIGFGFYLGVGSLVTVMANDPTIFLKLMANIEDQGEEEEATEQEDPNIPTPTIN